MSIVNLGNYKGVRRSGASRARSPILIGLIATLACSHALTAETKPATPPAPPSEGAKPFLGVLTEEIPSVERVTLGIEVGVRVLSIVEGSPAASKLRDGDIILTVAGQPISDPESFLEKCSRLPLGAPAALAIRRGKDDVMVEVTPTKGSVLTESSAAGAKAVVEGVHVQISFRKPSPPASSGGTSPGTPEAPSGSAFLGVSVADNPEGSVFEENGLPRGALVRSALPGSAAQAAGILPGDIITWAKGRPVNSAVELTSTISALPSGTEVQLVVQRAGQQLTMTVKLGSRP